jgi:formylglycine-generating enzyme required for sulfatase activity
VDERREGMVHLDGGEFLMGSVDPFAYPNDGEGPIRRVRLDPLAIDACAVSNAEFARFVEATRHVTEAERFGWSFVFGGLLPKTSRPPAAWRRLPGGARSKGRTGDDRRAPDPGSRRARIIRWCT